MRLFSTTAQAGIMVTDTTISTRLALMTAGCASIPIPATIETAICQYTICAYSNQGCHCQS
jgi:hypothetical protein